MNNYRTWQVKRGELVKGPFPEHLICEYIVLGRIRADDLLSADGHFWEPYPNVPEIVAGVDVLLCASDAEKNDPAWREERMRAVLRHLDERKQPDRRENQSPEQKLQWQARRQGEERRKAPETAEQVSYRRITHEVDTALEGSTSRSILTGLTVVVTLVLLGWGIHRFQGENTIKVDLRMKKATVDCNAEPAKGVDWHGCDKSGILLAGADLRGADLSKTNLSGSTLSYTDLTGARIEGANLQGTDLSGATWTDGRKCAPDSLGACR